MLRNWRRCIWRRGASHSQCEALIGLLWNPQALGLRHYPLFPDSVCPPYFLLVLLANPCTQPCISCDHSQVQALGVPRGNDLSEGPQGNPTTGPSLRASEARVLWNSGWKSSASRLFSKSPQDLQRKAWCKYLQVYSIEAVTHRLPGMVTI